jgi:ABC-type nitrate/sulfonate/bicarbonate transport system permease component
MRSRWTLVGVEIGATLLIVLFVAWYTGNNQSYVVATVPDMAKAFRETWLFSRIGSDFVPSIVRLGLGFGIAVILGVALGFVLGISETARLITQPVVSFMRSIPPVALLPAAIVLFGIGTSMKVAVIAFGCLWPVTLNTTDGVNELDSTMLATARTYGINGLDRLRYVVLPAVLPRIFAGMRTALAIAILLLVTSEMVASTNGIGFVVFQAQQAYVIPQMWAGIVMLGLLGYVLNMGMLQIEKRVLRWHIGAHGTDV